MQAMVSWFAMEYNGGHSNHALTVQRSDANEFARIAISRHAGIKRQSHHFKSLYVLSL